MNARQLQRARVYARAIGMPEYANSLNRQRNQAMRVLRDLRIKRAIAAR